MTKRIEVMFPAETATTSRRIYRSSQLFSLKTIDEIGTYRVLVVVYIAVETFNDIKGMLKMSSELVRQRFLPVKKSN